MDANLATKLQDVRHERWLVFFTIVDRSRNFETKQIYPSRKENIIKICS